MNKEAIIIMSKVERLRMIAASVRKLLEQLNPSAVLEDGSGGWTTDWTVNLFCGGEAASSPQAQQILALLVLYEMEGGDKREIGHDSMA